MYDSILFDLDGTLWDTCPVCADAWNQAAFEHAAGDAPISADDVRRYCGQPAARMIEQLFPKAFARHPRQLLEACDKAEREAVGRDHSMFYAGVTEGLRALARKHPLFIVSNCQTWYLEEFLRLEGMAPLFQDSSCHGQTLQPKGHNIRLLIERHKLAHPVYVGDTTGDETAAREARAAFVHAAYGFGSAKKPDASVRSFDQLVDLLARPTVSPR
jgi:phosphoglycolate phosphatase